MKKSLSIRKRIALNISAKENKILYKEHVLRTLFWECTLRCNARCLHCGSDCKISAVNEDMPADDFLKVIDSLRPHVDQHKVFIIFTGGEALMRKDLEYVGLQLYKREFPWGMVTNGIALTNSRLQSLLQSGMHSVSVSLDGFEDAHDWLRGVSGCFKKALNAIQLLVNENDLIWDVVTCVNQKNFSRLEEFKNFLVATGVKRWRLFTIFPVGRAARNPDLQIDNEQFTFLLDFIKSCRKEGKLRVNFACEGFLGEYETLVRDNFYRCNAGLSVASILSDGSISSCPSIRSHYYQGNIYQDDFWDVWQNRFQVFRNRDWMKNGLCADCKMWKFCLGNGFHLRDDDGNLLTCHYNRIIG